MLDKFRELCMYVNREMWWYAMHDSFVKELVNVEYCGVGWPKGSSLYWALLAATCLRFSVASSAGGCVFTYSVLSIASRYVRLHAVLSSASRCRSWSLFWMCCYYGFVEPVICCLEYYDVRIYIRVYEFWWHAWLHLTLILVWLSYCYIWIVCWPLRGGF